MHYVTWWLCVGNTRESVFDIMVDKRIFTRSWDGQMRMPTHRELVLLAVYKIVNIRLQHHISNLGPNMADILKEIIEVKKKRKKCKKILRLNS